MSPAEAAARFRDHPEAVAESARLAERLRFDLTRDLGYSYPGAEDPTADRAPQRALPSRCWASATPLASPDRAEAERRLDGGAAADREPQALSGFFLLHHEMLELAREVALEVRGPSSARRLLPPGRGRGSSVSSIVCYLTGLSHIDPVKNDLFLGRFLNEELDSRSRHRPRLPPRHPREADPAGARAPRRRPFGAGRGDRPPTGRAARSATSARRWGCRRVRSSGFARAVDSFESSADAGVRMEEAIGPERAGSLRWRALASLLPEIAGLPRHISQHPGGMVISTEAPRGALPRAARGDGGPPARPVGQGLLRRRRLSEDRPAGPGDAVGGRALRRRDRADAGRAASTSRACRSTTPRSGRRSSEPRRRASSRSRAAPRCRCCRAPCRRTSTTSPSRWRSCAPARSRAAPSIPTSSAASRCGPTPPTRCPTSTPRWSRCCATRSARSSSRTRCSRWRSRWRGSRSARPRGCDGR